MIVEIVSIQAALNGRDSIIWRGDVDDSQDFGFGALPARAHVSAVNEWLFRFFNRVEQADEWRLSDRMAYRLPSLSVGDLIHWGSKTYRVAGSGFEQITDSTDYVMALTAYTLKTIGGDER